MSIDGQGNKRRRNIAENFNRLLRVHQRYRQTDDRRQTTDGRTMTYSERELEFTFAKNYFCPKLIIISEFFKHVCGRIARQNVEGSNVRLLDMRL